jgi:serine/threonine protein kinase
MSLAIGSRLGPYEITAAIGAGGMGEVYRARDTKLGRNVALKIIPETYALDADRVARFKREAQVLASLNHPHIGAIYGFEDSGATHALVLELVEGETLADRIAREAIPLDDALPIAKQIAEALQAAHEHGIIHRDLKPANIKITPDDVVKVLDFGLSKLAHPEVVAGHADVTASPTITSPAMMTGVGMILGTAAYMAPEQARGRPADKRSDIWAFGCVLYEMLTGTRPFDGEDVTDVMVAVLSKEPDWNALPASMPASIRALLRRCLEKDRRKRVGDIAAARFALDEHASLGGSPRVLPGSQPWSRRAALTVGALAITGVAGTAVWFTARQAAPVPARVSRLTIGPSGIAALTISGVERDIAITPDGSSVGSTGATWTPDDAIIFSTSNSGTGLQRVGARAGTTTVLTRPDRAQGESDHLWPELLPGGRAVLFTIAPVVGGLDAAQVAVLDLQTGQRTILVRGGSNAHYMPSERASPPPANRDSGYLVYATGGTLRAVTFAPARLETRGAPPGRARRDDVQLRRRGRGGLL